jgi:hypothetical protein
LKPIRVCALGAVALAFAASATAYVYKDVRERQARRRAAAVVEPAAVADNDHGIPPRPVRPLYGPDERWPAVDQAEVAATPPDVQAVAAEADLERQIIGLEQPGAGGAEWLPLLQKMSGRWRAQAVEHGTSVRLSTWSCFKGGCTFRYAQAPGGAEPFSAIVGRSAEFLEWTGGKFESAPIISTDGHQEATWIFYAPSS